jgi:trigger factor
MAQIIREEIDQLNTKVIIIVEPNDYKQKYVTELQKYQSQGQMKGFRKGKTPTSMLEKLYGKTLLSEAVQNVMMEVLDEAVGGIEYLGDPIMSEDQPKFEFNPRDLSQSYTFHLDLGLKPKINIKGITSEDTYIKYEAIFDAEAEIDEVLFSISKASSTSEEVDTEVQDNDLISLNIKELEDGVEKQGGVKSQMTILLEKERFFDSFFEVIQGKKLEDTFQFNIFEVEKNFSETDVRSHYLSYLKEDVLFNATFEATIDKVRRFTPKELTPSFLQKYFGKEEPVSIEEARSILSKSDLDYYEGISEQMLMKTIKDRLFEMNEVPLPLPFLKRWVKQVQNIEDEDTANNMLYGYVEEIKWQIIVSEIVDTFNIEINENELFEFFYSYYQKNYGNTDAKSFQTWLVEATKDKGMIHYATQNVFSEKSLRLLMQETTIEKVMLPKEDFFEHYRKMSNARPKKVQEIFGEEDRIEFSTSDIEETDNKADVITVPQLQALIENQDAL